MRDSFRYVCRSYPFLNSSHEISSRQSSSIYYFEPGFSPPLSQVAICASVNAQIQRPSSMFLYFSDRFVLPSRRLLTLLLKSSRSCQSMSSKARTWRDSFPSFGIFHTFQLLRIGQKLSRKNVGTIRAPKASFLALSLSFLFWLLQKLVVMCRGRRASITHFMQGWFL